MRRMSAVGEGPWVVLYDLPLTMRTRATPSRSPSSSSTSAAPSTKDEAAKRALIEVIAAASTMSEAARTLGITRSHLYRQLQRYGLKPGRHARED